MEKKIEIIKDFAKKMGYTIKETKYQHDFNNRPCYMIELIGTLDGEGEPYSWAWYLDTKKEVKQAEMPFLFYFTFDLIHCRDMPGCVVEKLFKNFFKKCLTYFLNFDIIIM